MKNCVCKTVRHAALPMISAATLLMLVGAPLRADSTSPPVTNVTLSASPLSPQVVDTPVTFTAGATGGGTVEYEFAVKDPVNNVMTVLRPYGQSNTFSYRPTTPGAYTIRALARNVGSTATYEAGRWIPDDVVANPPVTSVTLSANPASPQSVNTPVTFTAGAAGGVGTVEYEFAVKDPVNNVMTVLRPYGQSNTFVHTPATQGAYTIRVFARNVGSTLGYEAVAWLVYNVTGPVITTLSSIPLSPDGANGWFKTSPVITLTSNVSGSTYYKWGEDYSVSRHAREWIGGGEPLSIRGHEIGKWYPLPFGFTFYGTSYDQVFLSTSGLLSFGSEYDDCYECRNDAMLPLRTAIAPLWDDLVTDARVGDDIYVFHPDADSIGFRWQAVTWYENRDANFEVVLYRDGRIRVNYGSQYGDLYGAIGISKGDGVKNTVVHDGDFADTNNIDSLVFVPSSWNAYAGPFNPAEGENPLYYYTVSSGGAVGAETNLPFKVDATAPIVSIATPLSGSTSSTMPLLNFAVSEVPFTQTVTVDGQGVAKTLGDQLDPLQEGPHTVRVDVTDNAGNPGSAEVSFTVVSSAPTVSITSPPAGFTTINRPSLRYTADYGIVTVRVDGAAVPKASGDDLDVLADGSHRVRVEALDASGHITSDEVKFIVDTTPPLSSNIPNFVSIAAGDTHSIGITADGTLWQWGATLDEGLSHAEVPWKSVTSPSPISAEHSWKSAAAGLSSNLAIRTDGTLWAWGTNKYGQLGLGDDTGADRYAPTQVGGSEWKAVSTGGLHSLGLKEDGTLWAWGYGGNGQLGRGDLLTHYSPVPVGNDEDGYDSHWAAIAAGRYHSVALKSDGTLWAWGSNWRGQLGYGFDDQHKPFQIGDDHDWFAISAGYDHTVALKFDGTLWAWGSNLRGQLGAGSETDQSNTPIRIGSETDYWIAISAGDSYTMAIRSDGTLWAWGANGNGQLGDGTTDDQYTPEQLSAGSSSFAVVAGVYHTMALNSNGTLWTWGENGYGQLGSGTQQDQTTPRNVFSASEAIVINNGAASTNDTHVTLTLKAWDVTSGVAFMRFSNDGITWSSPQRYAATTDWMLFSANGTRTVYATFQDAAGLWSSVQSSSIFLNAGQTIVSITSPTAGFTQNAEQQLNFTVNKMDAAVTVTVDGNEVGKASGDPLGLFSEGTHTVRVDAVDANGYAGSDEVVFTVDLVPPVVTLTTPASGLTNTNRPLLSYTVNKQPVTTVVKVDGSRVDKASGDRLDDLTEGEHVVNVETTDAYGYKVHAEAALIVDTDAPSDSGKVRFWKIDAGTHHAAAIAANGTLWAWGYNHYGQVGDGTTIDKYMPTLIDTDVPWLSVSAGDWHTVGIKSDRTMWAWGNNEDGELGIGPFESSLVPMKIGTDGDWAQVSAGWRQTVAIKTGGSIYTFGRSESTPSGSDNGCPLGPGGKVYTPSVLFYPFTLPGDLGGGVVDTGWGYTVVFVPYYGTSWSGGDNKSGQLGDPGRIGLCCNDLPVFGEIYSPPVPPVEGAVQPAWVSISVGKFHTIALKADGSLWGWGNGTIVPTRIGLDVDWKTISAGADHSLAIKTSGTLWGWGISVTDTPRQIGWDSDWSVISAGEGFSLALKRDGSLWTWGINTTGQLGDGTTENHALPQEVSVYGGSNRPISINGGADTTGSDLVTLSLLAWDATSGVASMKFKNGDGIWTDPEPYAATKRDWQLTPAGNGVKTVSVMFQDRAGNWSQEYSASILLILGTPNVTIASPSSGLTKNNRPVLSYTASGGSVAVSIDDGGPTMIPSGTQLSLLSDGTHTIHVEATNAAGTGYDDVSFTVDTAAPTVSISLPAAGTSKNRTPVLSYTASDGNVVVMVDGNTVTANSGQTLSSLPDGLHTVQVNATDAAGNRGLAQVSFVVDTTAPTIYIESPVDGLVTSNTVTVLYGVSDGAASASIDGSMSLSSGSVLSGLSNGSHTLSVSSTDVAGNTGSKSVTFMVDTLAGNDDNNIYCQGTGTYVVGVSTFTTGITPPAGGNAVLIASPDQGSTITGTKTIVKGAMDTTVPVNSVMIVVTNGTGTAGYLAQVSGKYFAAKVPVTADTTGITAIAMDQNGGKHQASVSVTVSDQASYVDLQAVPAVGLLVPRQNGSASLDVSLSSTPSTTHAVIKYSWDFDGSGTDAVTCYSHQNVRASFQQTGLYLSKVAVTDTAGKTYTDTAIVNVVSPADMDGVFKAIWNGMKAKLVNQDVEGALGYFNPQSQDRYRSIFTALSTALPQMAQDMQDIEIVYVTDNVTKYRIRRDELYGGQMLTLTYYIYFVKDDSGAWAIDRF